MAELVRGDVVDPGDLGGAVQFVADRVRREPSAVVGEQDLGGAPVGGCGIGRPWERISMMW
jgi:hypothetical protein